MQKTAEKIKKYFLKNLEISLIAEIMAPYAWHQMHLQIYSITIAFHLSITNRAYSFVLSVVKSRKVNKGDI